MVALVLDSSTAASPGSGSAAEAVVVVGGASDVVVVGRAAEVVTGEVAGAVIGSSSPHAAAISAKAKAAALTVRERMRRGVCGLDSNMLSTCLDSVRSFTQSPARRRSCDNPGGACIM